MIRWRLVVLCASLLSAHAVAEQPAAAPDEPAAGTAIVHPVDRALMVYVPSGYFIMGFDAEDAKKLATSLGEKDYHKFAAEEWFPKRREYVAGFFIDKFEVTNELWNKYTKATGYKPKLSKGPKEALEGKLDVYPAGQILWAEAQQYANWARKRLPFEAQWEKAARGTDGRWYPWGNEPPTKDRGVFPAEFQGGFMIYDRVGSRPAGASPYGALDMSGNMYEWTCEFMEPYPNNPEAEQMGSYMGHQNGCLRGGSFYHAMHALGCAKRFGFRPDETYYHAGFRTVWEPPAGYFKSAEFTKAKEAVPARKAEMEKLRASGLPSPVKGWAGG